MQKAISFENVQPTDKNQNDIFEQLKRMEAEFDKQIQEVKDICKGLKSDKVLRGEGIREVK